jgi:hypothetical protein
MFGEFATLLSLFSLSASLPITELSDDSLSEILRRLPYPDLVHLNLSSKALSTRLSSEAVKNVVEPIKNYAKYRVDVRDWYPSRMLALAEALENNSLPIFTELVTEQLNKLKEVKVPGFESNSSFVRQYDLTNSSVWWKPLEPWQFRSIALRTGFLG